MFYGYDALLCEFMRNIELWIELGILRINKWKLCSNAQLCGSVARKKKWGYALKCVKLSEQLQLKYYYDSFFQRRQTSIYTAGIDWFLLAYPLFFDDF